MGFSEVLVGENIVGNKKYRRRMDSFWIILDCGV